MELETPKARFLVSCHSAPVSTKSDKGYAKRPAYCKACSWATHGWHVTQMGGFGCTSRQWIFNTEKNEVGRKEMHSCFVNICFPSTAGGWNGSWEVLGGSVLEWDPGSGYITTKRVGLQTETNCSGRKVQGRYRDIMCQVYWERAVEGGWEKERKIT